MRKSFLLPLKFLLFFFISAAIFCLFSMIFHWGQHFSPEGNQNSLMLFFVPAAGNIVFPSVSAALLFTVFDYRKKSIGIIGALLLAFSVFAVLFFGFRLTVNLETSEENMNNHPFNSGKIQVVDGSLVYTEETILESSGKITGIVVRKPGASLPGFEYYKEGRFRNTPEPQLLAPGMEILNIIPHNPVYNHIFKAPKLFSGYLDDISFTNNVFLSTAEGRGFDFILLISAITAFLMICILFKGLTVWPLFEMILILFFHRIVFFLITLFTGEADFISETFFGGNPVNNIPLYTIAALSVLLLLSGLLLKTSKKLRNK